MCILRFWHRLRGGGGKRGGVGEEEVEEENNWGVGSMSLGSMSLGRADGRAQTVRDSQTDTDTPPRDVSHPQTTCLSSSLSFILLPCSKLSQSGNIRTYQPFHSTPPNGTTTPTFFLASSSEPIHPHPSPHPSILTHFLPPPLPCLCPAMTYLTLWSRSCFLP